MPGSPSVASLTASPSVTAAAVERGPAYAGSLSRWPGIGGREAAREGSISSSASGAAAMAAALARSSQTQVTARAMTAITLMMTSRLVEIALPPMDIVPEPK